MLESKSPMVRLAISAPYKNKKIKKLLINIKKNFKLFKIL